MSNRHAPDDRQLMLERRMKAQLEEMRRILTDDASKLPRDPDALAAMLAEHKEFKIEISKHGSAQPPTPDSPAGLSTHFDLRISRKTWGGDIFEGILLLAIGSGILGLFTGIAVDGGLPLAASIPILALVGLGACIVMYCFLVIVVGRQEIAVTGGAITLARPPLPWLKKRWEHQKIASVIVSGMELDDGTGQGVTKQKLSAVSWEGREATIVVIGHREEMMPVAHLVARCLVSWGWKGRFAQDFGEHLGVLPIELG